MPDGFLKHNIPAYDRIVVRELLVNALVHRPYNQRGDIFLNLYPDRLEVVNPGLLPPGVTPRNILHQSVRRNSGLARVFHDLKLMEGEGSGYDLLYETLVSQGKSLPEVREEQDRVAVVIRRNIVKPEVIEFMNNVDSAYHLRQREKIALGILAQNEAMTAREIKNALELDNDDALDSWIGKLLKWGLVSTTGRTKATRYFIPPEILHKFELATSTTLTRIEPHRLEHLILEDIQRYPESSIGQVHERIGREINRRQIRTSLKNLCKRGLVVPIGEKGGRKYSPGSNDFDKTAPNRRAFSASKPDNPI